MDWNDVHQALVTATPTSPRDLSGVNEPGVYAWWDPSGALAPFWPSSFPQVNPQQPLYVGIAKTTLTERAVQMHLKTTRMSTVRRSLSALLVDRLELLPGMAVDPRRPTKFRLAPEAEERLSSWMLTNLQTTWVLHPKPLEVEKNIISKLTPPLNYDHATHGPYAMLLQAHRAKLLLRAAGT